MGSALADASVRVAGKYERLAWERHERDLRAAYGERWNDPTVYGDPGRSQHPKGLWFDPPSGERACTFIERYCRHVEGEWTGQLIELDPDCQRPILSAVFGWMRADLSRRFRTAYIEIPRKNTKSTTGAGVGLFLTVADDEGGAQVYSAATKKDQAKIVHGAAWKMVKASSGLKKFAKTFRNNISCERLGSKFEPLGADSSTLDGLNTHGAIIDETHAHTDRHVYDVITTSTGARRQPLIWVITTAGVYDPESIGWELHERAVQILEGVIEDDSFFAIIYAADENDDPFAPETWAKANPMLGVSVKFDYLAEQAARAKTTPSFYNTFLRYHLNRWTQQVTRWIPVEAWNACQRVVDPEQLKGKLCVGAFDLSEKLDITAMVLCFPMEDYFAFLFQFWCPEERIMERAKKDRVPYDAWARDGWLVPTPGNVVDYSFPIAAAKQAAKDYELVELAYDPWNATQTALDLQTDGLTVVEHRQGYASMSEPSKEFEKIITAGQIAHRTPRGIDPVMRWMLSNVAIKSDPAGNIKPDKSRATGRIDGVIASVMALGRAIQHQHQPSVYETRGLQVIG